MGTIVCVYAAKQKSARTLSPCLGPSYANYVVFTLLWAALHCCKFILDSAD